MPFLSVSNSENEILNYNKIICSGSLGKYFRNSLGSFPKSHFLKVEDGVIINSKNNLKHLKNKFKIGVSWKSFKNRYFKDKSIELQDLKKIVNIPDCDFINVQYGNIFQELE